MTRRILINGRRAEEVRVAIVENQTLEDYEIETKSSGLLRNNIYRGVVSNIAPSLNAAFVDFGDQKNGFLAFNDVVESVYAKPGVNSYKISDVLVPGQKLIVQVIKDATGMKGAQVTTNISLAGRYLVLRPKDSKSGVSHKIDEEARADLTQKVRSLDLPDGYGCIVRTNAMDQPRAMLLKDAKALVQLWHKIENEAAKGTAPQLLYNDQDIVVSVMRDYFDSTINEVMIDDRSCFERARTYVSATMPNGEEKLRFYEERLPLFTRFGIEKQIEQIYARTVRLPSGGFIVIDPTEALTAIDVNSAHASKRETQDLTAYHTNLEAAVEIGRQLRMRDIGGLIVVDFIDMRSGRHQRDVERVMRNAMARDKARNRVERISANGLLEINRQRISQALSQRNHLECPTCGGRGFIPSAEAIAMSLIREIDARAANGDLGGVRIKLHPDIAQQLQNERRREFAQIENEYDICIEIVGSREMSRGDESIEWLTSQQTHAMRPERNVNAESSATSIIDVAEVYQNQQGCDEIYRPNDFEEFSSEEARRKRASRRALKQMNAANAPVVESAPQAAEPERHDTSIAYGTANFAMLSALIEHIPTHMNDKEEENGRRRHKFAPRRRNRRPESSVSSDLRMFAFDILKSVCVVALGAQPMISKRDMLAQLDEAAAWLFETSQLDEATQNDRYERMRSAIPSRHATMRLAYLYGEKKEQPDEVASLLCGLRDEATADSSTGIEHLRQRFDALLPQIFAPSVGAQEKETAEAKGETPEHAEDVAEPRKAQEKRANLPIAPKHIRHHHRATIEESGETQTIVEDAPKMDEAAAGNESVKTMMTEEAEAQENAQTMQTSRRSVRRSRRTQQAAADHAAVNETAEAEIQTSHEAKAEENAPREEKRSRRDRRTRTTAETAERRVVTETAEAEIQTGSEPKAEESAPTEEKRMRRDRRTARAAIGETNDARETATSVVETQAVVTSDVEIQPMTEAAIETMETPEAAEMPQTSHRSVRRSRRTSRVTSNHEHVDPNAVEETQATADVPVETQPTTDEIKAEETMSVERRTRRDRRTSRVSIERERERGERSDRNAENSKVNEIAEEVSTSVPKAAEVSVAETMAVVTSDIEIKPMTTEDAMETTETPQTLHRSVRRSRRTSRAANHEDIALKAAEAPKAAEEPQATADVSVETQPTTDAVKAEDTMSVERRARRDRRTSRASIERERERERGERSDRSVENSKVNEIIEEVSTSAPKAAEISIAETMAVVTSDVEIKPMTTEEATETTEATGATEATMTAETPQTSHRSVRRSRRTSRAANHEDIAPNAAEAPKAADAVEIDAQPATDAVKAEENVEKRARRDRKTECAAMKTGSEAADEDQPKANAAEVSSETPANVSSEAPRERAVRRTRRTQGASHRESETGSSDSSVESAQALPLSAAASPLLAAAPSSATNTSGATEPKKEPQTKVKPSSSEVLNAVDEGTDASRVAVESGVQTRSIRRTRARRMAMESASEGQEDAKAARKERSTSAVQAMAEAVYEHRAQPNTEEREPIDIIMKQPESKRTSAPQEAPDTGRRRALRRTRPHLKSDNT